MSEYLVIYEEGDTSCGAYSPDVPGVFAVGKDRKDAETLMAEALPAHIELLRERGMPIPEPHHGAGTVCG